MESRPKRRAENETCMLCGCKLHRTPNTYAKPDTCGRSHATNHHLVAERFFGRSVNRPGEVRAAIFEKSPWLVEEPTIVFCYECHEEVIHNPVFLKQDLENLAEIIRRRGLNEDVKAESREKLAGRIQLLHEVIEAGIEALALRSDAKDNSVAPGELGWTRDQSTTN